MAMSPALVTNEVTEPWKSGAFYTDGPACLRELGRIAS